MSCGIPDFRSRDGVYARLSVDFPDLPDPQAMFDIHYFRKDPRYSCEGLCLVFKETEALFSFCYGDKSQAHLKWNVEIVSSKYCCWDLLFSLWLRTFQNIRLHISKIWRKTNAESTTSYRQSSLHIQVKTFHGPLKSDEYITDDKGISGKCFFASP